MSTPVAWRLGDDTDPRVANSSRILDFLLAAALPIQYELPGVGVPVSELAALALVGLASLRRPVMPRTRPLWFAGLLCALLGALTFSALLNDISPVKRLGHLVSWVLLALVLSSGRIDRVSACRGLALGLSVDMATAVLNLAIPLFPAGYNGRLTGLVGDPNVLGYYLVTLGAVALVGARPGTPRVVFVVALLAVTTLTWSRTSMTAAAFAVLWLLLRRIGRTPMAVTGVAVGAYLGYQLEEALKNWGPFAERAGSDALRERIQAASDLQVAQNPWFGRGPGTSRVLLQGQEFFYHNSYLSVLNEGGRVALAILVAVMVLTFVTLLALPREERHPWHEAAILTLAFCAFSTGEVLLELPAAVVLGLAMRHVVAPHELQVSDGDASPDHIL